MDSSSKPYITGSLGLKREGIEVVIHSAKLYVPKNFFNHEYGNCTICKIDLVGIGMGIVDEGSTRSQSHHIMKSLGPFEDLSAGALFRINNGEVVDVGRIYCWDYKKEKNGEVIRNILGLHDNFLFSDGDNPPYDHHGQLIDNNIIYKAEVLEMINDAKLKEDAIKLEKIVKEVLEERNLKE